MTKGVDLSAGVVGTLSSPVGKSGTTNTVVAKRKDLMTAARRPCYRPEVRMQAEAVVAATDNTTDRLSFMVLVVESSNPIYEAWKKRPIVAIQAIITFRALV
jgi:hypothetical protein